MKSRICMFLNAPLAGDQRVYKEVRTLADAGYQVSIICAQEPDQPSPVWPKVRIISIPRRPSVFCPGRFTFSWIKEALSLKPDIVHAHDLITLGRAAIVSKLLGARLVYDSHEYWSELPSYQERSSLFQYYVLLKERYLSKLCDRVIIFGERGADEFSRLHRMPVPTTIMNCVESKYIAPADCGRLRNELNLSRDDKIILHMGGMYARRGLYQLIDAMKYLSAEHILVFLGGGYSREALMKYANDGNLSSRIKFLGPFTFEEYIVYAAGADIGVIAFANVGKEHTYALPNKLFEYIALGLPMVVSNFGEIKRIVEKHQIGRVFDENNPEKMAMVIEEMLSSDDEIKLMRESALDLARKCFNWENEARKLLEIYQSIAN